MPVIVIADLDFGYPWWLNHGHLVLVLGTAALLAAGVAWKWSKWMLMLLGGLVLWSGTAYLAVRFALQFDGVPALPTQSFLRSGAGRVLDLGAGTGRSSIMVLQSRPQTTVVALDLFERSFDQHFGVEGDPQQRLLRNLQAAGVDKRATIQAADMRKLPFEDASFDGIVSSYAVDHLNREGIGQTLREAARVVKPGGEFLLMVIGKDLWLKYTFGPLLMHGGPRGTAWWAGSVKDAGFRVLEEGMAPATSYVLARRE